MQFNFCKLSDIFKLSYDNLVVIIDKDYDNHLNHILTKNIVIPHNSIFDYDNEAENDFYIAVANRMKSAGFNGFMDWISKVINSFNNDVYHDENDKLIIYKQITFATDNDIQKTLINKIFSNFGFSINDLKIANRENGLF